MVWKQISIYCIYLFFLAKDMFEVLRKSEFHQVYVLLKVSENAWQFITFNCIKFFSNSGDLSLIRRIEEFPANGDTSMIRKCWFYNRYTFSRQKTISIKWYFDALSWNINKFKTPSRNATRFYILYMVYNCQIFWYCLKYFLRLCFSA